MTVAFCYVTCASAAEAHEIARALVEERLAAAGNILPEIRSVYRWRGAIHEAQEAVLILKTRLDLTERIVERVKALHGYECPCVTTLPAAGGNPDYLRWIAQETADPLDPIG